MNSGKVWFREDPLWNGMRFQMLVVAQISKISVFYGIRQFTQTGSYREPDKSNPYPGILLFNINYNIVLPSTLLTLKLSLLFRPSKQFVHLLVKQFKCQACLTN